MKKKIAIIGGGAAGFFTAINLAELSLDADITLYEASNKLLAKVLISGGGRCNVTNSISDPSELVKNYPRGQNFLKPVFEQFSSSDTKEWFAKRGVLLKTEEDGRVFPVTDSSRSIYNCLIKHASQNGVKIKLSSRLKALSRLDENWNLKIGEQNVSADAVVLATGSNNQIHTLLAGLDIDIVTPLPSLFTFNAENHLQLELAGVSMTNAIASIKEIEKSAINGPILVTHWGYSAPSILKLSAWNARELAALQYNFTLVINWDSYDIAELKELFLSFAHSRPKEKVSSWRDHGLPKRLWQNLLDYSSLRDFTNWSEIGKKGTSRLVDALCKYEVKIRGKSTFKEEFVTAGGISLDQVNPTTFNLVNQPNLFAVGELLDIDAITGGFNFQAAWSGSFVAARAISAGLN